VTAEVDRGGGVVDLVRQDGQLVVNQLSNRRANSSELNWLLESFINTGCRERLIRTFHSFVY